MMCLVLFSSQRLDTGVLEPLDGGAVVNRVITELRRFVLKSIKSALMLEPGKSSTFTLLQPRSEISKNRWFSLGLV